MKEHAKIMGCTTVYVIFGVLLLIGISLLVLAFNPTFHNLWIKTFRSSNEYVSTKQTLLFKLVAEYERLEVKKAEASNPDVISAYNGQQEALLERIERESGLLQDNQVPQDIKIFLAKH